jgi:tRNA nucleotidyltransferase (CCA-adding enzyme)
MKDCLAALDPKIQKAVKEISDKAKETNTAVYIVGGVVRDILLGQKNLDLDVLVLGDAIEFAKKISRVKGRKVIAHANFGTATIFYDEHFHVDFASARKETYAYSGALPHVSKGGLLDDLFRRDFTINAMAINISHDQFGELADPYGGCEDLKNQKIRILHDQSFEDDPTRVLRAVRFEQRLNFKIEERTQRFLKEAIEKKVIENVKPNRYFMEFKKILREASPVKYLRRIEELTGWSFLHKDLRVNYVLLNKLERRIHSLDKHIFSLIAEDVWMVFFLGLAGKLKEPALSRLGERFHFKSEQREILREVKRYSDLSKSFLKSRLSSSQAYQLMKPHSSVSLIYLGLASGKPNAIKRVERFLSRDIHVKLLINGHDIRALGVHSGEKIRKILAMVLDHKLDGFCRSKDDELNFAKKLAG